MKTHVSLPTRDVNASVSFYRALLDVTPAKHFDDYALFISDDPGIELALDKAGEPVAADRTHYGIAVDDSASVEAAIERLTRAGLALDVEREETCCYATQTKAWAVDPDGRRWEVYAVLAETDVRDECNTQSTCCTA